MAWIAVHDSIKGPKIRRMFKMLGCSEYEAAGILVYFWIWALENTDKNGLILYADEDDVEHVIATSGANCRLDPKKVVKVLFDCKWLEKAPNGIIIHDWDVWQEFWYKAKERRERDTARKREARRYEEFPVDRPVYTESPAVTPQGESEQMELQPEPLKPQTPTAPVKPKSGYSDEFLKWWDCYPRKIDKGNAYKKYQARRNDGFSAEELLTAVQNYARECRKNHTENVYIKHPKTFLSETLPFTDYLPKKSMDKHEAPDGSNPFSEYEE